MNRLAFLVNEHQAGLRIDKLIANETDILSRSGVQKILDDGLVKVNGKIVQKSYKAQLNDSIEFTIPNPVEMTATAQEIQLDIVYEDNSLLVVNKPKGMVVHPAAGNPDGTLVNALLHHCKESLSGINGIIRPGIVHRIDKDTSGLLIVAKNDTTHISLASQLKEHSIKREYRAIVIGNLKDDNGTIDVPLGRSPKNRKKQAVNGINPRNAVTHYNIIERYIGYTYASFRLETGRTHQIRVHCAYLGHPILGDCIYGPSKNQFGLNGQCLHAISLGFVHPLSGEYLEFSSELPDYFSHILLKLRKSIY